MLHAKTSTETHTFVFADLVGYTSLTSVIGDDAAADLCLRFLEQTRRLAERHHGEVVKLIGDAVMIRGVDAARTIRLGLSMSSELGEGSGFPPIRIGMDTGPAVSRGGDWFGATVNVAARVCRSARGNEVLLTERTLSRAQRLVGVQLHDRGLCAFKNVVSPVGVFAAQATRPAHRHPQPRFERAALQPAFAALEAVG